MPSVQQNLAHWASKYDWSGAGDEWSNVWGGTPYLWYGVIYPRILAMTPVDNILEIAPGFGRCTQYLQFLCDKLTVVDLSDKCIEHCKERFKLSNNIDYHVNDGKSLDMVADDSIDFVFSWDSMVHVEKEVLEAYISQLATKLKYNGFGFVHHSNIGIYMSDDNELSVQNKHWRAQSMTAELFRDYCCSAGLTCISQEIIKWGDDIFNDCISVFAKIPDKDGAITDIQMNPDFMVDARKLRKIAEMYKPKL